MGEDKKESRRTLLEQASRFLLHPDIRDAPHERKVSFLEGKALRPDEIQQLLESSSSTESATTGSDNVSVEPPPSDPQPQSPSSAPNVDPPSTPVADRDPSPPGEEAQATDPQPTTAADPPPSSQPPIITYPEFLVRAHAARAQQRSPLAHPAVAPALYASALLTASVYALNSFALRPMHDALTAARTELFGVVKDNLQRLNVQLESAVSSVPPMVTVEEKGSYGFAEGDESSEASDPTELFHRDVGVQTLDTPPVPPDREDSESAGPEAALEAHSARLRALRTHVAALRDAGSEEEAAGKPTKAGVEELRQYLDRLALGGRASGALGREVGGKGQEDEVAKVRAEIRSVKGMLLSARSFPGGVMGRARAFGN